MSYILDALKKADAERERGSVPGLHSQPMAMAPEDDDEPAARAPLPIVWIGAGAGLCLIAVLSWQLLTREPAVSSAVPATATVTATQDTPAATALIAQSPAPVDTAAPIERRQEPPMMVLPAPAHDNNAVRPAPAPPMSRNRSAAADATPAPVNRATTTNDARDAGHAGHAGSPPPATAPTQPVPTLQELPDDIRREIPPLTIGGAMYSETPSSRMLIINSQVFHEGDKPYQGLTLDEIRLKSAVFSYRGYHYSINY